MEILGFFCPSYFTWNQFWSCLYNTTLMLISRNFLNLFLYSRVIRGVFTWLMIGGFGLIIYGGPLALMLTVSRFSWPAKKIFIQCSTIWKFQDFSITQILREINLENLGVIKLLFFATLGALNLGNLVSFRLQKVQKFIEIKIQSLWMCKMTDI